jgi:hypothetical protein
LNERHPAAIVHGHDSGIFGEFHNSVDTRTSIGPDNLVLTDPKPGILVHRAR